MSDLPKNESEAVTSEDEDPGLRRALAEERRLDDWLLSDCDPDDDGSFADCCKLGDCSYCDPIWGDDGDDDTSCCEHRFFFEDGCRQCELIAELAADARFERDAAEAMAASLPDREDDGLDDDGLPVIVGAQGNPIALRGRHSNRYARSR